MVGYDSEAAFHRAFKRHFGMDPAAWRKKASTNILAMAFISDFIAYLMSSGPELAAQVGLI